MVDHVASAELLWRILDPDRDLSLIALPTVHVQTLVG
jgi:hypothetical protein